MEPAEPRIARNDSVVVIFNERLSVDSLEGEPRGREYCQNRSEGEEGEEGAKAVGLQYHLSGENCVCPMVLNERNDITRRRP